MVCVREAVFASITLDSYEVCGALVDLEGNMFSCSTTRTERSDKQAAYPRKPTHNQTSPRWRLWRRRVPGSHRNLIAYSCFMEEITR